VHNDLNASNILLDASGNALLADFGVATVPWCGGGGGGGGALGTPASMAPENADPAAPLHGAPPADIFSFALLLLELATGHRAWQGLKTGQVLAALAGGRRPDLPAALDAELAGLIRACWAQAPEARPCAAQVVAWLSAMEWGRARGPRVAPGAAWLATLRDARAAAGGSSPSADAAAPPVGEWVCAACTLINGSKAAACGVCESARPGVRQPLSPPQPPVPHHLPWAPQPPATGQPAPVGALLPFGNSQAGPASAPFLFGGGAGTWVQVAPAPPPPHPPPPPPTN
jgi:serine/threonine protein kinase